MSRGFYSAGQQREISRIIPDLIRNRGLLRDLVSKELRARYRNAMMGFLWAVLQPVLMMAILTFVFGYLLRSMIGERGGGHPYAVSLLCGLVPWLFLSTALTRGANSLLENKELIKKVYFPRELIPIASVTYCLVNVLIGFVTLLVVMALLMPGGISDIGIGVLYVPLIFAINFVLALGLVLLFSALNVHYNDVGYMIEVALAFGFYATPILYPLPKSMKALPVSEELGAWLYRLYLLNPMANLVPAYRQALLENVFPDAVLLLRAGVFAAGALLLGVYVFRRNAPTFADYL